MPTCHLCKTCQYLYNTWHGDYHLHCAPHPYGPPGDFCPDWEKEDSILTQRAEPRCHLTPIWLSEEEALIIRERLGEAKVLAFRRQQQPSIQKKLD